MGSLFGPSCIYTAAAMYESHISRLPAVTLEEYLDFLKCVF